MGDDENLDSLAAEFQHLGTADIPVKAPILSIPLNNIYDDFYHNPLDWSCNNVVAFVDSADVYMVMPTEPNNIRTVTDRQEAVSVKFSPDGRYLAVGTYSGALQVFDVETNQMLWEKFSHECRIACLAWNDNNVIFTGSRDKYIMANDPFADSSIQVGSHHQEVCGLKVSPLGDKLVSGGNDNNVKIWDISSISSEEECQSEAFLLHKSAIKAIDFSPTMEGVVATGGGCNDGKIYVWNVHNREIFKEIEIDKQITNLHWLESGKEIITTYGFGWNRSSKYNIAQNHIDIWSFETMKVGQRFEGHSGRVLFSAMAPNKEAFVTAASDNTLKFWKPSLDEWVFV